MFPLVPFLLRNSFHSDILLQLLLLVPLVQSQCCSYTLQLHSLLVPVSYSTLPPPTRLHCCHPQGYTAATHKVTLLPPTRLHCCHPQGYRVGMTEPRMPCVCHKISPKTLPFQKGKYEIVAVCIRVVQSGVETQ